MGVFAGRVAAIGRRARGEGWGGMGPGGRILASKEIRDGKGPVNGGGGEFGPGG